MKYLVVGSGGREHVLAWRLLNDGSAREVYVMPGNGGIDKKYCVEINPDDHAAVIDFCGRQSIDFVVVGPEAPLVRGLSDALCAAGIPVFGPSAAAALLEGSKLYAKEIMVKYGVPTAQYWEFDTTKALKDFIATAETWPLVIKLDGLAAGKGVGVCMSRSEAEQFIADTVLCDGRVLVEEFLDGEEASVLGICDGKTVQPLIAAQDHKRAFDGDRGPNTGGMGAYAPAPVVTAEIMQKVKTDILQRVVDGMRQEGHPFTGILYAGLMIKNGEAKVLEFNVRFGDPEAQVILPLLDGRLGDLLSAAVEGRLDTVDVCFKRQAALTVVMASGGYPGNYPKGKVISGLDTAGNALVFHAGTKRADESIVTDGGRVLAVTGMGDSLQEARDRAYSAIEKISFDGGFYRRDIGYRALS